MEIGFEIEYMPTDLAYLRLARLSPWNHFGLDGDGLTGEYRSPVFHSLSAVILAVRLMEYTLVPYKPLYSYYEEKYCQVCKLVHHYPMSGHLSLSWKTVTLVHLWRALRLYLYKVYHSTNGYRKRLRLYPDFIRLHKERVEFRFLSPVPTDFIHEVSYIIKGDFLCQP